MIVRGSAVFAAVLCIVLGWFPARAATIQRVNANCFIVQACEGNEDNGILISGEIVRGDYAKFRKVVVSGQYIPWRLFLRSAGGDVNEALQIGRLVRELYIQTEAPVHIDNKPNCFENSPASSGRYRPTECVCASACFFIYAAGIRRNEAFVGIHRFFLNPATNKNLTLQESINRMRDFRQPVVQYLQDMGVPSKYVDIMFATSSREIYVPTSKEIRADLLGYPPEVMEWLMAQCETTSDRANAEAKKGLLSALSDNYTRNNCFFDKLQQDRSERYRRFKVQFSALPH